MPELEITICSGEPEQELKPILDMYQNENRVSVDLHYLDWSQAWTEFLQMTLYGRGPVVSETGTTWMNSLAGRNSLREFTREEVRRMGGAGRKAGARHGARGGTRPRNRRTGTVRGPSPSRSAATS